MNKFEKSLLLSMNVLNKTRVVLLFSMNKFCSVLVSMEINLKLLPDFFVLIKTSNHYFEMSGMVPYLQNKVLFYICKEFFDTQFFQGKLS